VLDTSPEQAKTLANAAKEYKVSHKDLPLCCPMPHMTVWNSHPRVYIPIEKTGEGMCYYCGAHFILTDFKPV
jgi:uncharacterized Zn-finger protein